jgi:integrase
VAIAILLTAPIRRHNLATIHLDSNLHRPGDGAVYLVFTPEEIKNRQAIEFELSSDVASMIDRLLATRSPRLCPPSTPRLFPRRDGSGPMHEDSLSKRIRERIRRETGLAFNPHLFRHLSAKLLLDTHPGGYETVRHLLGHSRLSSTLNVYMGLEADTATRLFADVIDAARRR